MSSVFGTPSLSVSIEVSKLTDADEVTKSFKGFVAIKLDVFSPLQFWLKTTEN